MCMIRYACPSCTFHRDVCTETCPVTTGHNGLYTKITPSPPRAPKYIVSLDSNLPDSSQPVRNPGSWCAIESELCVKCWDWWFLKDCKKVISAETLEISTTKMEKEDEWKWTALGAGKAKAEEEGKEVRAPEGVDRRALGKWKRGLMKNLPRAKLEGKDEVEKKK